MVLLLGGLVASPCLVSCGGKEETKVSADDDGSDKEKKKKKKKSDEGDGKEAESEGGKGLSAKDNDPEVVSLAKKIVEGCEMKTSGFDSKKCPNYQTWTKGELFAKGKNDATLVNFLDDDEVKVRHLAATALDSRGEAFETDEQLAKRVVDALEREKDEKVASRLASAVADIKLADTKLVDRVLAMIDKHPMEKVRQRLVNEIMFQNRETEKIYAFVKATAKSHADEDMRHNALRGFWTGTPRGKGDEVCALWREIAETDKSAKVAEKAIVLTFQNPNARCAKEYEATLKIAEARAKAGDVKQADVSWGLKYLFFQKKAEDAQKKKALAIAKVLVDNTKNDGSARGAALRFIGEADPGAKAYAAKFDGDEAFMVKNAAKDIKDGKIKLKKE